MILINLKIQIKPEKRDDWLAGVARYTEAVRAEAGCISFDYYESPVTPNTFAVIESFTDNEAGDAHVQTSHFKEFIEWFPSVIAAAPVILNTQVSGDGWTTMHEFD